MCRKPCRCPKSYSTCCPDGYLKGRTECECPKYPTSFCCPTSRLRRLCKCPMVNSGCCPDGYNKGSTTCECPWYPGSFCCPPLESAPGKKKKEEGKKVIEMNY